jgi:hypothetical protein
MSTLGSIRVVSKRKGGITALPGDLIVDIDRTNPVLGNPHVLHNHKDPIERASVIASQALDVEQDLARSGPIFKALNEIAKKVESGNNVALRCWCAPEPCHGDLYAQIVAKIAGIQVIENQKPSDQQHSLF